MAKLRSPKVRPQEWAYLITAPLFVLAVTIAVPLGVQTPITADELPFIALFAVFFAIAQVTVLPFEVRRHAFTQTITEIPLLVAFYYLSPVAVISCRVLIVIVVLAFQRYSIVKLLFNASAMAATTAVGAAIVAANRPDVGGEVTPRTWLILAVAVTAATAISLVAVIGVISLVQGFPPLRRLVRTSLSVMLVAVVNIIVGLVVLIVYNDNPWAVLLLLFLGVALIVVYRSYSRFVAQHRSLTELYELTRAMADAGRNGTLPDLLLGRVRDLLQAEQATLWLTPHGRYPETLLSARVDSTGLLDVSSTPPLLRERAVAEGVTLVVGPKVGDPDLRTLIRESGGKDAIVVPLRSGEAVIGSLEVIGRLGDLVQFGQSDVRLLETLAAHAAVAVENSRLIDRLRFDAYHDALTGLPNRRRVLAQLDEALKVRAPGEVVAVLLFDIDGLRDVNDSLGHDAGDQMVVEVGARLRRLAPAAALVGRMGSDEFAITLRLPDVDGALRLANQLRTELQQPLELDTITLDVDVAIGVAVHPDHGTEAGVLLNRAGLAAQAAKQFVVPVHAFNPGLQSRSAQRSGLAADMRHALESGEIEVFFQPKVTLPDRRVVGVECLARWDHPAHGQVPPADFVAIAEHTGQLGELTEVVLHEALRRARDWLDSGRPLPVAVNLSARTLTDPSFPTRIAELLAEHQVPAELLTLEITEDGMIREPDRPLAGLKRLSEMGVRLAVDDFGAGYSSLSYLRRLPVDEVKIDRSFVEGMATDEGDLAIVRAVVALARHFGLVVVAEGVESERTVGLLEDLGCDMGQGFLFSRPLPFERFEAWLAVQAQPPAADQEATGAESRRLRAVQ